MGLKAVANPAAGGQPGSFTTLTVTGNATIGGTLAVTGGASASTVAITGPNVAKSGGLTGLADFVSTATAGVGVGPRILFSGNSGNSITPYPFGSLLFAKASNSADNYSGIGSLQATDAGGGLNTILSFDLSGLAVTGAISATGLVTADTLRVNVTPTAEVVVATHTAVFNINGTNYKFLCLAA